MKRQHLVIDRSRAIPRARIDFPSGLSLLVVNDTMINVNELAEWIWSQEYGLRGEGPSKKVRRNYINAVKRKSVKAYEEGIHPLLLPMANNVFIEMEHLSFWLDKWCHRDKETKELLHVFDMEGLKKDMTRAKLEALKKAVKKKLSVIKGLQEELQVDEAEIKRLSEL